MNAETFARVLSKAGVITPSQYHDIMVVLGEEAAEELKRHEQIMQEIDPFGQEGLL